MGVAYNSKIVTDGLVLCFDAANIKSYPGVGSIWYNLANSNNNATIFNGTFDNASGGNFTFDGSSKYMRVNYSSPQTVSTFSYSVWLMSTSGGGYKTIIDHDNDQWWFGAQNFQLRTYNPDYFSGFSLNVNTWYNVVITHTSGNPVFFYVNGNLISSTGNDSSTRTYSNFMIGAGSPPDELWTGKMSLIMTYNRSLTATEVQQNFNATRKRYNI